MLTELFPAVPKVQVALARPSVPVVAELGVSVPPPDATEKLTLTPDLGLLFASLI